MNAKQSASDLILQTLEEKSILKQDVFDNTSKIFEELKEVIAEVVENLRVKMEKVDKRIEISYKSKGHYEAELRFAGDVLVFHMHTNVFDFDKSHPIWKTSYVQDDNLRSFCGMINVFNFLSDSIKYNRVNDLGYMVARIFINKDSHYFVEGKRQLGYLYNDFVNAVIDKQALKNIVESAILYSLSFDLLTPPYESVKEISVNEIQELASSMKIKTGKRLGFEFEAQDNAVE